MYMGFKEWFGMGDGGRKTGQGMEIKSTGTSAEQAEAALGLSEVPVMEGADVDAAPRPPIETNVTPEEALAMEHAEHRQATAIAEAQTADDHRRAEMLLEGAKLDNEPIEALEVGDEVPDATPATFEVSQEEQKSA